MTIKDKDGRWIDSAGCAIPPKYVKPMDKKRDAMVEKLIRRAQKISGQLAAFRALVLEDVEKYLKYIEEHYQVNGRTREGNKQLTNFSNNIKLELRVAKNIEFDEKLADFYGVRQIDGQVVFSAIYPRAQEVQIAGDFNGWNPASTTLQRVDEKGKWQLKMPLDKGLYRYRLVVDGQWQQDPYNDWIEMNPYGEFNSVLNVE